MSDDVLRYREEGLVGVLTINRPDVLNAIDHGMVRRLGELLEGTTQPQRLRALVITGAGRAFSAGHDLRQPPAGADEPVARVHEYLTELQRLTTRLLDHPAIIIAAINGPAVGMAAELCVAADLRLAAEEAYLLFPEVRRALFETNGVMYLLPRAVGQARASDWLLTGRRIPAGELLAAGFVSRVLPAAELLPAALEMAEEIAASAPRSIRLVKRLLQRSWQSDLTSMLLAEVDGVVETISSPDLAEGLRAFLEKRDPRYTGA
ncbi:MAG TPA: enoyl-CoA hydratase/isomerase family protein [Gemmatimonadales bacterium]